jgi:hypothetical protein
VEAFNKILEKGLTKVCCANHESWEKMFPAALWPYQITTKKLHKYTPFQLVYVREVVVLGEFISPSLFVAQATKMTDNESIAARVTELMQLDEARFLADFHHTVEKSRQKA